MEQKIKKWVLLFVLLVLPYIFYTIISKGENSFVKLAVIGEQGHIIPPFSFMNQDSIIITNVDYEENIYIANFIFTTCPTICPTMTINMSLQKSSISLSY